jgi:hypothetical protein
MHSVDDAYDEHESFDSDLATARLNDLVKRYWLKYCEIIKRRFEVEVKIKKKKRKKEDLLAT